MQAVALRRRVSPQNITERTHNTMKNKTEALFAPLSPRYSTAEAKAAIDALLAPYGETCRISFRQNDAEITDSYLVDDMDVRHTVCEIIARTGVTKRTYENLAAEWQVHNVAYQLGIGRSAARDVSLDYAKDPRSTVRLASDLFDKLDIE